MQQELCGIEKQSNHTLASATDDAVNAVWGFFTSSSDEHSAQTKRSNFLASSIVMPTQAG
jgi:hypothetical protein